MAEVGDFADGSGVGGGVGGGVSGCASFCVLERASAGCSSGAGGASQRLADRLHRMQIRAVIIGVPLRIEIVVPPRKASVERPSLSGFLAIDLCVVLRVPLRSC